VRSAPTPDLSSSVSGDIEAAERRPQKRTEQTSRTRYASKCPRIVQGMPTRLSCACVSQTLRLLLVSIAGLLTQYANAVRCQRNHERRIQPHREHVGRRSKQAEVDTNVDEVATILERQTELSQPSSGVVRRKKNVPVYFVR
jgi:hypothetical protein